MQCSAVGPNLGWVQLHKLILKDAGITSHTTLKSKTRFKLCSWSKRKNSCYCATIETSYVPWIWSSFISVTFRPFLSESYLRKLCSAISVKELRDITEGVISACSQLGELNIVRLSERPNFRVVSLWCFVKFHVGNLCFMCGTCSIYLYEKLHIYKFLVAVG